VGAYRSAPLDLLANFKGEREGEKATGREGTEMGREKRDGMGRGAQ